MLLLTKALRRLFAIASLILPAIVFPTYLYAQKVGARYRRRRERHERT